MLLSAQTRRVLARGATRASFGTRQSLRSGTAILIMRPQLASRAVGTPAHTSGSRRLATTTTTTTAAEAVAESLVASAPSSSSSSTSLRPLAYWLLGTGTLVAGMVTIGGVTRLTKSGLSMTDWKVQGSLPPLSHEDWVREFDRYKQFPEYQQRKGMRLEEFKSIFWWEYGHRMTGRFLGLAYALPLLYFSARGRIPRILYPRLATLFALGGTQGLIGWWMVKSGLEMDPEQRKEIRVSPYRLATHLGMAFTTYTLLIWTGLDLLSPAHAQVARLQAAGSPLLQPQAQQLLHRVKGVRSAALAAAGLLGVTILSGAFVAGNDAGRAYNTFPKMGDDWIPEEMRQAALQPLYRNLFENTAIVQFDHRVLALSTASAIGVLLALARGRPDVWRVLPSESRKAITATAGMVAVQVSLGISTLVLYVPTALAVAHQAGSLVLLTLLTWSVHTLKFVKRLPAPSPLANATHKAAAATKTHTTAAAAIKPQ